MNKQIIILFIIVFGVCLSGFAEDPDLMDRAVKKYLRGDYTGAIDDFERVLELGENEKAKTLLYKSIVEEGRRKYSNGEYENAVEYLERAQGINPADRQVADLLSESNKKIRTAIKLEKESKVAVDILQEKITKEKNEKNSYRKKIGRISQEKKKLQKNLEEYKDKLDKSRAEIENIRNEAVRGRKIFIIFFATGGVVFIVICVFLILSLRKLYLTVSENLYQLDEIQEKFSKRMEESEKQGEELEEKVAKNINKMIDEQKTVVKQLSQTGAGKTQTDIREIKDNLAKNFEQQQEKLIELLQYQARALSASERVEKIDVGDRVITDVNPNIRARADSVELIPKTITDPNIAEKVLRPYLDDSNNRVRGNACVSIFQYNPELAIKALERMAESPDKWMRLSAAWAVGEIGAPEAVHILRKLLDDVDEKVKDRAVKAFENMAELKEDIAKEIRDMINESKQEDDIE